MIRWMFFVLVGVVWLLPFMLIFIVVGLLLVPFGRWTAPTRGWIADALETIHNAFWEMKP